VVVGNACERGTEAGGGECAIKIGLAHTQAVVASGVYVRWEEAGDVDE
jgi:hypothetical protein